MRYDDAALERALGSLGMEDTPPDLHARIMRAVSQRPEPAFRTWELWLVGIAIAACAWLILAIAGVPLFGGVATVDALSTATSDVEGAVVALGAPGTILWVGLGVVTAFVLQRLAGSRLLKI